MSKLYGRSAGFAGNSRLRSASLASVALGVMMLAAQPAQAALVSACAGVTLPTSALNGVVNPLLSGLLGPLLFTNTNLTLATTVLGASANPCDSTADTFTATTVNATTVNATTVNSNIYQLNPAVQKGISIGGNAITGLGAGVVANAGGLGSISIGNGSSTAALATNATAIGSAAQANGINGVAIGNASIGGPLGQNVAIGGGGTSANAATAAGGAVAIGRANSATGDGAIAIGDPSVAVGQGAIAEGFNANAAGNGAVALGNTAIANGQGAVAAGSTSSANGPSAIALGDTAKANAAQAIALGLNTNAFVNSIAVGSGTVATGTEAVAIGNAASALNNSSIAVGNTAKANGDQATAVGNNVTGTGIASVVVGSQSSAVGVQSVAIGHFANTTANNGVAIGQAAIVVGNSTTQQNSTAIGANAFATGNDNVALGVFAAAGTGGPTFSTGDTAIGLFSNANGGGGGGQATALGTYSAATAGNATALGSGGTAALSGTTASAAGATALGGNAISGARATGANAIAIGGQSTASNTSAVAIGRGAAAGGALGVALGDGASTSVANSVALGSGSTITVAPAGVAYNTGIAAPAAQVEIGGRRITGVSAGSAPTDGVNVSQLAGVAGNLAGTVNGSFSATGVYTPPTYITANGTTATTVQGALTNETASITNLGTSVATNTGGGAAYNPATGTVTAPTYTVQGNTYTNAGTAFAGINTALNNINNGTAGLVQQVGGAPGVGLITVGAGTQGGAISVVNANGGNRTITGVAPGSVAGGSVDAVDGGQLNTLGTSVATSLGGGSTFNPVTGTTTAPAYTVGGTAYNNVGAALGAQDTIVAAQGTSAAANAGGGATYNPATGVVSAPAYSVANIGVTGAVGAPTTATSTGGAVAGLSTDVTNLANNLNSGTVGPVQRTVVPNQLALIAPGGTAAVPGAAQNLTNVAPGAVTASSTDAVNGSQLFATNATATTNAANTSAALGGGANVATGVAPSYTVGATAYNNVGGAIGALQTGAPVQYATAGAPTTANGLTPSQNVTLVGAAAGPVTLANVAAGSTAAGSTQAVNGGQINTGLASVATSLGGGSTYDPVSGTVTAPSYTVVSVSPTGVVSAQPAQTSTGGAVGALNTDVTNLATTIGNGSNVTTAATGTGTVSGTTVAKITPGSTQTVTAGNNIAVTQSGTSLTIATNPDLVSNSLTTGGTVVNTTGLTNGASTLGATGLTIAGGPSVTTAGLDGGGKVLANIAPGVAGTDAVNVNQLATVSTTANNSVQYDNGGRTQVTLGGVGAATPVVLTNVAPAALTATSTDAVNGSQLFATNTAIAGLNNGTAGLVQQMGGSPGSGQITVGAGTQGTSVNFANSTLATRTLTGVSQGAVTAVSTDAVNGSQLFATNATATTNAANTSAALGGGANVATGVAPSYTVGGTAYGNVGSALGAQDTIVAAQGASAAANAGGGATYNPATGTVSAPSYTVANIGATGAIGAPTTATNTGDAVTGLSTDVTNIANNLNAGTVGPVQRTATPNQLALIAPGGTAAAPGAAQTLTNVAAGVATTDAVNVGQLNAVGTVAANSVQYDGPGKTMVTLGGVGAATPTTLTNVAPGALTAASTDAVNGSQLFATNTGVGGIAGVVGGTYDPTTGTYTGPTYTTAGATTATTVQGAFNNYNTAIAGLSNGTTGLVQQVGGAPGNGTITIGAGTQGNAISVVNANGGNRTITGVASGSVAPGSVDAVNGGQLASLGTGIATNLGGGSTYDPATGTVTAPSYTVQGNTYTNVGAAITGLDNGVTGNTTAITNLANTINNGTAGTVQRTGVTNGLALTALGGTGAAPGAAQTLGNVAAGVASTDAVNVGQLNAVGAVATNSVQYDNPAKTKVTLGGAGAATPTTLTNVAPAALTAASTDAVNGGQLFATNAQVATNTTNIATNTTAINNLSNGTSGIVQQTGGSPGNGAITVGAATGGTVVNIAGTAGVRTLTGLKDGVNGSDAVTVAQINNLTGGQLNVVQYDTSSNGGRSNTITLTGGAAGPVTITNLASGNVAPGSTDAVTGGQLAATNAGLAATNTQVATNTGAIAGNTSTINQIVAGQAGAFRSDNTAAAPAPVASGANATAGGFGASATGAGGLALGNGAVSTGTGSVAIGSGSTDNGNSRVVSVGGVGSERRVTNVAPGVSGTDAVNFSQLQAATTSFGTTTTGLQNQINQTNFDLNQVRRRANGGTAGAMAVAGLPQAFEPGKTMVGGAFGFWADQVAFAVGASGVIGDNAVVKVGASISGQGIGGFNLGAGFQF